MQVDKLFISQDYGMYLPEHHEVWAALCHRQNNALKDRACSQFREGLEKISLDFSNVPRLADINDRITPITGWKAQAVPGYLDSRYFFQCLQRRVYPTTITLRDGDSMDYIEEPDIFHDVFGHVALMADPIYGELMRTFGDIHGVATSDQDVLEMTRLFWFTIEFGLIQQDGQTRILGSGLLSSHGEAIHCLSARVDRKPFMIADVVAQPFRVDVFQDVLFIAESLEQLIEAAKVLLYQIKERNSVRWPAKSEPAIA